MSLWSHRAARRGGPLRIPEIAPSKGPRRFKQKHKGHKPSNNLTLDSQAVRVMRMFKNLQESGWTFYFTAEAKSPRGFTYEADGGSPLEAFLKAFGQWRNDVASFVPSIPRVLAASKPLPTVKKEVVNVSKRENHPTGIKKLLEIHGPKLVGLRARISDNEIDEAEWRYARVRPLQLGHPINQSPDNATAVSRTRVWKRLYMRAYRNRQRLLRGEPLVAA